MKKVCTSTDSIHALSAHCRETYRNISWHSDSVSPVFVLLAGCTEDFIRVLSTTFVQKKEEELMDEKVINPVA